MSYAPQPVECAKGLYCDFMGYPPGPGGAVCKRLLKAGEPCTTSQACESGQCNPVARYCVGRLCDGKGNGPPAQLDVGPIIKGDAPPWPPPYSDWKLPYSDWKPSYPDWKVLPGLEWGPWWPDQAIYPHD